MAVVVVAVTSRREALFTMEREVDEAEHVGGRQQRRQHADNPQDLVTVQEGLEQDLVLREEAGQAGHAGDGDRRNHERPVGDRDVFLEATHLADVLFAVQRVDDRARAQEQAGLEERVGHQVEDAGAKRAHAHGQEHVAELRDG